MYSAYPISVVSQRERFDYFQSVVDRVFCPMQVQRTSLGAPFLGSVEATDLGKLRLARVASSACTVRRASNDVGQLTDPPYLVKFQLKGEALWCQRNRRVHLRSGDFVIASAAEPYSLQFFDVYEMPVLAIASRTMRTLTPNPEQFLGVRMAAEDADCGLLSSFVAQVVNRMSRLKEPMISRLEANVLDLLGGVLAARAAGVALTAEQQLSQILAYIERHVHDRRLGSRLIAGAFGVSPRHVHSLFETQPLSLGGTISELRAAASRQLLGAYPGKSLTQIALECGFYDLSHMCRSFRQFYGVSPGEYRSTASADLPKLPIA